MVKYIVEEEIEDKETKEKSWKKVKDYDKDLDLAKLKKKDKERIHICNHDENKACRIF